MEDIFLKIKELMRSEEDMDIAHNKVQRGEGRREFLGSE